MYAPAQSKYSKESAEDEAAPAAPELETSDRNVDKTDTSTEGDQIFGPNIRGLGDPNAWPELDSPKASLALGETKSAVKNNKGISFTFEAPRKYRQFPELYLTSPSVKAASVNAGDSALYVGG